MPPLFLDHANRKCILGSVPFLELLVYECHLEETGLAYVQKTTANVPDCKKRARFRVLKGMTFASDMVACPFYMSCFFLVLFFSIELELSPQADLTPCLSSSNTSTDKYCQPQTHRASLAHSHKQTHTGLRGLINKPPTALFQSLERHIVGLAVCVCVCFATALQNKQAGSIRSLVILHYSPWNASLYTSQHGLSI